MESNNKLCKCEKGAKHCTKPTSMKQLKTRTNFAAAVAAWNKSEKTANYREFISNFIKNAK